MQSAGTDGGVNVPATVQLLLQAGADVNAQNYHGTTPLYLAAQKKQLALAEQLLAAGAQPALCNADGEGPAAIAAAFGALELLALLRGSCPADGGAAVLSAPDKKGRRPLFCAAIGGQLQAMQLIVTAVAEAAGADAGPTARACARESDQDGNTPFLAACGAGQFSAMQLLLSWEPSCIGDINDSGETALMVAARAGNAYLGLWLLGQGADATAVDRNLLSVLHHAAAGGDASLVAALRWNGAPVLSYASTAGLSELTLSAAAHADDGLGAAPPATADAAARVQVVVTPAFYAAATRQMEALALLLGGIPSPLTMHPLALVTTPGPGGLCNVRGTPLAFPGQYYCATDGADFAVSVEAYEAEHGSGTAAAAAAPSGGMLVQLMCVQEQAELLCAAAESGDAALLTSLIGWGVDANGPCLAGGKVPLQFVDAVARPAIAELLAERGATMFIKVAGGSRAAMRQRLGTSGFSELHQLVWRGAPAGVLPAALLSASSRGAPALQSGDDPLGRTPLHHAAALERLDWCLVLAEYGAADTALDVEGWTALHAAAYAGSFRAVELLLGADDAAEAAGGSDGGGGGGGSGGDSGGSGVPRRRWFNSDVDAETVCGAEDAWELALRGERERYAATAAGRRAALAKGGAAVGAAVGLVVGLGLSLAQGDAPAPLRAAAALAAGLVAGLLVGVGASCHRERKRRQGGAAGASAGAQAAEHALLLNYPRLIERLRVAGAMPRRRRALCVKLPRTARFCALCIAAGLALPFALLRALLEGGHLATFFLHLQPPWAENSSGGRRWTRAELGATLLALVMLALPLVVLSGACDPALARVLAIGFAAAVCLALLAVLAQALREKKFASKVASSEEEEEEEEKGDIVIRRNRPNAAVAIALLLEAGQLCQISLAAAKPYWQREAPGLFAAFQYVSLQFASLTQEQADRAAAAKQGLAPAGGIGDLGVTDAMQFWSHVAFALVWGLVTAKLAGCCIVRGSAPLRERFRFVVSDFYGRSAVLPVLVPLLTGGAFLPIMVSLLGVLQCGAFNASDGGDDDALVRFEGVACFEGTHLLQAVGAMLALLFYAPTAFLVSMTFLQRQDDEGELDIRSSMGFETLLSASKSALSVVVTFTPTAPRVLLGASTMTSLVLVVAAVVRPPCAGSRLVTVVRVALYAFALWAALSGIAALADGTSGAAVWAFVCGCLLTAGAAWVACGGRFSCSAVGQQEQQEQQQQKRQRRSRRPSSRKSTQSLASHDTGIELRVAGGEAEALRTAAQKATAERQAEMRAQLVK